MNLLPRIYEVVFGCHHGRLGRVLTINKRTYQVCLECGKQFEYSLVLMRSLKPSSVDCADRRSPRRIEVSTI
jgi:hypothetical protein